MYFFSLLDVCSPMPEIRANSFWLRTADYRKVQTTPTTGRADEDPFAHLRTLSLFNRINTLSTIHHAGRGWIGACYSVAEILTTLYFELCSIDQTFPERDYILLSKGHASAMQYACLSGLGMIGIGDLMKYKHPDGPQAHTDRSTPGIEVNTGSLGQTLSKAAGLAMAGAERVIVILGDGELQEGQNYEALMSIAHQGLHQVIPIIDVNGLQTDSNVTDVMDTPDFHEMMAAFGFDTLELPQGNDAGYCHQILTLALECERPTAVIARTHKGAGLSFMAANQINRRGYAWHGKAPDDETYIRALIEFAELKEAAPIAEAIMDYVHSDAGKIGAPRLQAILDKSVDHEVTLPQASKSGPAPVFFPTGTAYGRAIYRLAKENENVYALDADLENSCKLGKFSKSFPERFVEVGIAEQNMASMAGGFALRGKLPFVNTYAAFLKRCYEQIYVNATEGTKVVYVGHYAGLCYAPDGKTHQSIGDVAMMRAIPGMRVLYPAFAQQVFPILKWAAEEAEGPVYVRLHRRAPEVSMEVTPEQSTFFRPGIPQQLVAQRKTTAAILTAGPHMTAFCRRAIDQLQAKDRLVDLWTFQDLSIIDAAMVQKLAETYQTLYVIEETHASGGLHDLISSTFAQTPTLKRLPRVYQRATTQMTLSTLAPWELYQREGLLPCQLKDWILDISS